MAVGACSFASSTLVSRYVLSHYPLSPLQFVLGRTAVGVCLLLLLVLWRQPGALWARRDELPVLALMGVVGIALLQYLVAEALQRTSVAVAIVLLYTAPAFVALASWLMLGEGLSAGEAIAVPVTFLGALLVSGAYDPAALRVSLLGVLAGLGSGFTYGVYTLATKRGVRKSSPWTLLLYPSLFAIVGLTLVNFSDLPAMARLPAEFWAEVAVIALLTLLIGYGLYISALRFISATQASVLATLELVLAPVGAVIFLGESMQAPQVAGALLVFAGSLIATLRRPARSPAQ